METIKNPTGSDILIDLRGDRIVATQVAGGFDAPLFAASAPGDPGRLYVVEKNLGQVLLLDPSTGARSVFLDIPANELSTDGERGLLGLAFHPSYQTNGRFFVHLTNANGDIEVRSYTRSTANPDVADPNSGVIVITIPHSTFTNHNGGALAFGPDGYLYVSVGDGGGVGDPGENAQNTESLLGKILRLDVNRDDFPGDPTRNYGIPADNPFVGQPGADEVWAYGLRNPWRISFDSQTGDLYIADVGLVTREEIDFQAAGSPGGRNYGWDIREGTVPFEGNGTAALVDPIFEYDRALGQAVTGGYVYHGPAPGLQGAYIFADFGSGRLWSLRVENGRAIDVIDRTNQVITPDGTPLSLSLIASFGVDGNGELYAISLAGDIFRLSPFEADAGGNGQIIPDKGNVPVEPPDDPFAGLKEAVISGPGTDRPSDDVVEIKRLLALDPVRASGLASLIDPMAALADDKLALLADDQATSLTANEFRIM
jgi:glucose/arabinose dehydrogenase